MRIGVLTSSRADFGIYYPLLRKLNADDFFNLKIIAFGTHFSMEHGFTANAILESGFKIDFQIESLPESDSPESISKNIGNLILIFSDFWLKRKNEFDIIFALGDRFEMFAAVCATIPFSLKIAHFHGGETTEGAIDNIYRHAISLMSSVHFTATEKSAERVKQLINSKKNVFNVGSLSLEGIKNFQSMPLDEWKAKFGIELNKPIVVIFHPETIRFSKNEEFINEICIALAKINDQIIISLPNNDTGNNIIRNQFLEFEENHKNVHCINSLGTEGYFTLLKNAKFIIGNSSSGIIEAASFGKYVINLGDRQKGRERSNNLIDCEINADKILECIRLLPFEKYEGSNVYEKENPTDNSIEILKTLHM